MRITATRRLQYAIGHRVFMHESKCRHLHGHNFVFYLTAGADLSKTVAHRFDLQTGYCHQHPVCKRDAPVDINLSLDSLGRVIDFGVLKSLFDPWFSMHWDHGMVLSQEDDEGQAAVRMAHSKLFVMPYNPTAENLARFVLEVVGPDLLRETPVQLISVEVHETENGIAKASL